MPSGASPPPAVDRFRCLERDRCCAQAGRPAVTGFAAREETDVFALSAAVEAEITAVLERAKFAHAIPRERRAHLLDLLRRNAIWFEPKERVIDCRDFKDNKYLELALAAGAETIVSSDEDLLVLHPWRGIRILRPAGYLAAATR